MRPRAPRRLEGKAGSRQGLKGGKARAKALTRNAGPRLPDRLPGPLIPKGFYELDRLPIRT